MCRSSSRRHVPIAHSAKQFGHRRVPGQPAHAIDDEEEAVVETELVGAKEKGKHGVVHPADGVASRQDEEHVAAGPMALGAADSGS